MSSNQQLGVLGEKTASSFLTSKGLTVIEKNFHTKYGEIDIIAKKENKYYFVEVKARIGDVKGKPYEAITTRKISHLKTAAELYVLQKKIKEYKLSLQAISIVFTQELQVEKLDYFENILL